MQLGVEAISASCPDEAALVELAAGALAAEDAEHVREHLGGCDGCRLAIAALVRAEHGELREHPPGLAAETIVAGRYRLGRRIGSGGMGEVHEAWDLELERRVALKTLLPRGHDRAEVERRMARLVRESKAMARLRHPNVVAVFDAGRWRDQAYVVMELVDGETLRAWLGRQHAREEIVEMFVQAGRGLQAAHVDGVVHRDFKPDNVLVDEHGRVQVTDFGLARIIDELAEEHARGEPVATPSVAIDASGSLTETGTAVGTPAYMAPEQFLGHDAGAAADVFAFAVALYEALAGERPFVGDSPRAIHLAQRRGASEAPLRRADVPAWLRAAILDGLHYEPTRRIPDVAAMLRRLVPPPPRRRRWIVGGVATAGVGVAVAIASRAPEDPCAAEQPLRGVWDDGVRGEIERRVAAGSHDWPRVREGFDRWAAGWASAWAESCAAGDGVRGACLSGLRQGVDALAGGMATGSIAIDAAELALPPVSGCAADRELALASPEPDDPSLRTSVRSIRDRIIEVETRLAAAERGDRVGEAEDLLARARGTGFGPIEAEALGVLALAHDEGGQRQAARASYLEAAQRGTASGHDVVAARSWTALVHLEAEDPSDPPRGHEYAANAMAAAERVGTGALARDLQARVHYELGVLAWAQGRGDDALAEFATARADAPSFDDELALLVLEGTALAQAEQARYDEALATHLEVADRRARELGDEHPSLVLSWSNIAAVYVALGRVHEAEAAAERATRIARASRGTHHPEYGLALHNQGELLRAAGRYDEALALLREAEAVATEVYGADHPRVAAAVEHQAGVMQGMGRYEDALALMRRALGSYEQHHLAAEAAKCRANLADVLREANQLPEALVEADIAARALAGLAGSQLEHGYALGVYGETLVQLGRAREAIDTLERAVEELGAFGYPGETAVAEFALARAIVANQGDRARAIALADAAEQAWAAEPRGRAARLAALRAWRAELADG